jgi:RinA family phage transcriptional activator
VILEVSKPKHPYWSYVKSILRDYPRVKKEVETPLDPRVTTVYGTYGHGSGGTSNPTMDCVIHDVPEKDQIRYDAVNNAIQRTIDNHPDDAEARLLIVDLVYFKKTHTIEGAGLRAHTSKSNAGRWQAEFIRTVADELKLP